MSSSLQHGPLRAQSFPVRCSMGNSFILAYMFNSLGIVERAVVTDEEGWTRPTRRDPLTPNLSK